MRPSYNPGTLMLGHDIPPSLPAGSNQRRTRAKSRENQLDDLINAGFVGSDARKDKKRRNVEFTASTDNLGKLTISSPLGPRIFCLRQPGLTLSCCN